MEDTKEILKKVCLLGDAAVGKTSLIRRYVFDKFDDKYLATIGTKVTQKILSMSHPKLSSEIKLVLLLWDILGQKDYQSLHPLYYRGAEGGVVVCDLTRRETLSSVGKWVHNFYNIVGEVPLIFIANKSDLRRERAFGLEELREETANFNGLHFITSAKTGENVNRSFYRLGDMLLKRHFEGSA